MKTVKRTKTLISMVLSVILCYFLFFTQAQPALATDKNCSITIYLEKQDKQPVSGIKVQLYLIGEMTDYRTHEVSVTNDFKECAGNMDFSSYEKGCTVSNGEILKKYINSHNVRPISVVLSDKNGKSGFSGISPGVYLVTIEDGSDYKIDPFLIETPLYENQIYEFQVIAYPKVISVSDNKVNGSEFDQGKSEESESQQKEPNESESDNSKSDNRDKDEKESESDTHVSEETTEDSAANGENRIPQTGQLKWPVPVLAVLGITLITFGVLERFSRRSHKDEEVKKK